MPHDELTAAANKSGAGLNAEGEVGGSFICRTRDLRRENLTTRRGLHSLRAHATYVATNVNALAAPTPKQGGVSPRAARARMFAHPIQTKTIPLRAAKMTSTLIMWSPSAVLL
jgi:hypothetical protein